jgi:hypothetical protein
MITTKDLVGGLGRNLDIIKAQTKDLSHADSLLQPPFRGNCLNWVPVCGEEEGVLELAELVAKLESAQNGIAASLEGITQEDLAAEVESFLGTTTLAQLLFFLYWHESYHVGQTEMLRQLAGKDDAVI